MLSRATRICLRFSQESRSRGRRGSHFPAWLLKMHLTKATLVTKHSASPWNSCKTHFLLMKMALRDTGWWKPLSSQQHFFIKLSPPSSPSCLISVHLGNTKDRVVPKKPGQWSLSHTCSNSPTLSQPTGPNWADVAPSVQTCTEPSDVFRALTLS